MRQRDRLEASWDPCHSWFGSDSLVGMCEPSRCEAGECSRSSDSDGTGQLGRDSGLELEGPGLHSHVDRRPKAASDVQLQLMLM